MGKLALWIGVVVAVMLVLRLLGPGRREDREKSGGGPGRDDSVRGGPRQSDEADKQGRSNGGELMMGCAVCGVHLPASDAVFSRGRVYCGTEHRDQDRGRGEKEQA